VRVAARAACVALETLNQQDDHYLDP